MRRAHWGALAVIDGESTRQQLVTEVPFTDQADSPEDRSRAWICINRSCRDPVTSAQALQALLGTAAVNGTAGVR